jgi:hypothetical protein
MKMGKEPTMQKLRIIALACLGWVVLGSGREVAAQYVNPYYPRPAYGPSSGPALSPYLDLRRGGNPATNYFLGTLPELDRRAADTAYRAAILNLDVRTSSITRDVSGIVEILPGTGHPVLFQSFGPYYNLGAPGRTIIAPTATAPPSKAPPSRGSK